MTRTLKVLKAILITGAASGYLMQTCVFTGNGFSILPNIGLSIRNALAGFGINI